MDNIDYIILGFLLISGIFLGWFGNDLYKNYNNELQIKGLWFSNWNNITQVKDYAYSMDSSGEWVCINVNNKMDYEDIVNTCQHEAGHELFARKCQDNPEICFKLEKEIENE